MQDHLRGEQTPGTQDTVLAQLPAVSGSSASSLLCKAVVVAPTMAFLPPAPERGWSPQSPTLALIWPSHRRRLGGIKEQKEGAPPAPLFSPLPVCLFPLKATAGEKAQLAT